MNGEWDNKPCPLCGLGTMHDESHAELTDYRGHSYRSLISQATCDNCHESLVYHDPEEEGRWTKFRDGVDAAEQNEIKAIREALGLSQSQAAEITGGGHNAFSRYERGEAKPVLAVVNLLRLLGRHPELLQELGVADPAPSSVPSLSLTNALVLTDVATIDMSVGAVAAAVNAKTLSIGSPYVGIPTWQDVEDEIVNVEVEHQYVSPPLFWTGTRRAAN
jgi:HTH-type transcriptional regulator/antitoxin MqsA